MGGFVDKRILIRVSPQFTDLFLILSFSLFPITKQTHIDGLNETKKYVNRLTTENTSKAFWILAKYDYIYIYCLNVKPRVVFTKKHQNWVIGKLV